MITDILVYNEVLGEGAVNTAAVLTFSEALHADAVDRNTFSVIGRTIENAYVTDLPQKGAPKTGCHVILELDHESVLERVRGRNEHINIHYRSLAIYQRKAIVSVSGKEIPADPNPHIAIKNTTPVTDSFFVFTRDGLKYNLFVPEDYDKSKAYPLVVFIHDAGCNSHDPAVALLQGCGATAFASRDIQSETPCFILAPEIPAGCRMTTDEFTVTPELEKIMDTIRSLTEEYAIDPDRITLTGQSMGCMGSCELLIRYPDYFAGALLVAGQWSPERMAEKVRKKNLWIIVSEGDRGAFPGMNAVTEAMEQAGATVKRYRWNGQSDRAELEAQAAVMAADDTFIKYSIFDADSVKTKANSGPGANHGGTWALVYTIRAVCKWLVSQRRN